MGFNCSNCGSENVHGRFECRHCGYQFNDDENKSILEELKKPKVLVITGFIISLIIAIVVIFWPEGPYGIFITTPQEFEVYYDKPFPANYRGLKAKILPITFKAKTSLPQKASPGKIVWHSNLDGYLGEGRTLTVDLSVGDHTVIAKYVNDETSYKNNVITTVKRTPPSLAERQKPEPLKHKIRKVKDQEGDVLIVDIDKGIITDTSTQLMWMKCPEYYRYSYHEAVKYARNCKLAGYNDWRLPTYKELKDISNIDNKDAIIHRTFDCYESRFWTSTICASESNERCKYFFTVRYTEYTTHNNAFLATTTLGEVKEKIRARLVRDVY